MNIDLEKMNKDINEVNSQVLLTQSTKKDNVVPVSILAGLLMAFILGVIML